MPDAKIKEEDLTLGNLGNGGAVELFEDELANVLENILDVNTEAKAKRKITLVVTFKPSADRDSAEVETKCTSALAPMNSAHATVFLARHRGKVRAITHDPRQLQMEFDEDSKPRTVKKGAAGA